MRAPTGSRNSRSLYIVFWQRIYPFSLNVYRQVIDGLWWSKPATLFSMKTAKNWTKKTDLRMLDTLILRCSVFSWSHRFMVINGPGEAWPGMKGFTIFKPEPKFKIQSQVQTWILWSQIGLGCPFNAVRHHHKLSQLLQNLSGRKRLWKLFLSVYESNWDRNILRALINSKFHTF